MPTFPVLANTGAMSQFVGAFEVTSKLTGKVYQCRFSHMWNGIATRHSDTIDTKFFVDSEALVVGLNHTGFVKFREKTSRDLFGCQAAELVLKQHSIPRRAERQDLGRIKWCQVDAAAAKELGETLVASVVLTFTAMTVDGD